MHFRKEARLNVKSEGGADVLFFSFDESTGVRTVSRGLSSQTYDDAILPRVEVGADIVRRAQILGMNPAGLMERYDEALPLVPDLFDRYRRMLDRLDNPMYLSDEKRDEHIRYLTCGRQVACEVFAKHDYVQGIDSLVGYEIVNAKDLDAVIDRLAGNPLTVTAMARLLELKRSRFDSSGRDYSL
jgi:hypothetical protein